MKPTYLSTLTPLRGIAALLIVSVHFNLFVMPLLDPALTSAHFRLYLMVDFFFILSGFIMSHVYGNTFLKSWTKQEFWRYMSARFARIYPLHLITLGWVIVLYILLVNSQAPLPNSTLRVFNPWAIPFHLTLTNAFFPESLTTWNLPAWSISVEWWMYLAFPFLLKPIARGGAFFFLVSLALIALGYYALTIQSAAQLPDPDFVGYHIPGSIEAYAPPFNMFRCLLGFVLGMITYQVYTRGWGQKWLKNGWLIPFIGLILLAFLHLVTDLLTVWAFPLLILVAVHNTGRAKRILEMRPFQRLGDWSYSIYMVHVPLIFTALTVQTLTAPNGVPAPPPAPTYGIEPMMVCLVFMAIVVGLASLFYRFVEVPARKYLNSKFRTNQFSTLTQVAP